MKLTNADKIILRDMDVPESDFAQIKAAAEKTVYEHYPAVGAGWKIGAKRAIELLGRRQWLSGLSRSAFHYSALQKAPYGDVYFDSSRFFQDVIVSARYCGTAEDLSLSTELD